MENELITLIKKVNPLNYITDEYKSSKNEFMNLLSEYEKKASVKILPEIAEFIAFTNGKMFDDWILFKSINKVSIFGGKIGDIGLFYSLKNGMQYDAFSAMKSNSDIIKTGDFLFAEATPGDYLTISFNESDYGKIYFIDHDADTDEPNRILVAESLQDLINSMFLKDDE